MLTTLFDELLKLRYSVNDWQVNKTGCPNSDRDKFVQLLYKYKTDLEKIIIIKE
jgi:hypothetical protein